MTKKKSLIFKWLIISLITLGILLWVGFFFFSKSKEEDSRIHKENQIISRGSNIENRCFNCNKKVEAKDNFCPCRGQRQLDDFHINPEPNSSGEKPNKVACYSSKTIKIQKTSSGNYFINWSFSYAEGRKTGYEEGKTCYSLEKMPEILTEYRECWENNDWSRWEKELKDNYLLVKSREMGEGGQFQHQTYYQFHPISQADREEAETQQRIKDAERIREECKERAKEAQERVRKWKEEHKNEWRTCSTCGRKFCLETEGIIRDSVTSQDGGPPVKKREYFCDQCHPEK